MTAETAKPMKFHDWVPNALSDAGGNVCRNCGLVTEAYYEGDPCTPHPSFQGIPGFPRKQEEAVSDKAIPERYALDYRTLSDAPVPSETWEWDRQRHVAMGQFAKRLIEELGASEAALSEAQQCLDRLQLNRDSIIDLQQQVTQQAATISQLRRHVKHENDCRGWKAYDIPCSCGLDAALASLPK